MLLNLLARSMKLFDPAIENMERFKYVQDSSKYNKGKKEIEYDKNGSALSTISKYTKRTVLWTISINI